MSKYNKVTFRFLVVCTALLLYLIMNPVEASNTEPTFAKLYSTLSYAKRLTPNPMDSIILRHNDMREATSTIETSLISVSPATLLGVTTSGFPESHRASAKRIYVVPSFSKQRAKMVNEGSDSVYAFLLGELDCLALNIYFEARSEPEYGRRAVSHVVLNRVMSSSFPKSVCGVVRQGGEKIRWRCQFSWWCDGLTDKPRNQTEWENAWRLAREIYLGESKDPTGGALWYHADYVSPYWRTAYTRGPKIGRHIFYRRKGKAGRVL